MPHNVIINHRDWTTTFVWSEYTPEWLFQNLRFIIYNSIHDNNFIPLARRHHKQFFECEAVVRLRFPRFNGTWKELYPYITYSRWFYQIKNKSQHNLFSSASFNMNCHVGFETKMSWNRFTHSDLKNDSFLYSIFLNYKCPFTSTHSTWQLPCHCGS